MVNGQWSMAAGDQFGQWSMVNGQWPRGTSFPQLPSAVNRTVDHPYGSFSCCPVMPSMWPGYVCVPFFIRGLVQSPYNLNVKMQRRYGASDVDIRVYDDIMIYYDENMIYDEII
jgi:hypothetical protein